jgi:hypothetical protein
VCFSPDPLSCIENISFIAVDDASDIDKDKFSGLVGLSPTSLEKSNVPPFIT